MLTQAETDTLIAMVKHFVRPPAIITIPPGADYTYELANPESKEEFLLDVWRGTLRLSKVKLQNRVRKAIVLVRLDVDGAPHTNPDGIRLPGTHIHVFREGYDDKWAQPVDTSKFTALGDTGRTFLQFCAFCNIQAPPPVQEVIL